MTPTLKSAYDDFVPFSDETGLKCEDPSMAQQHQKDETDINLIVRRFTQTGELPQHHMPPLTEDFADITDMQSAMNRIVEAREAFMEQPAEIRSRFHNDAAEFVAFCSDPKNHADMRKMGLLNEMAMNRYQEEEDLRVARAIQDKTDAEAYRKAQAAPKS